MRSSGWLDRDRRAGAVVSEERDGRKSATSGLMMSYWNCRGLSTSVPYLKALMEEGSKVVVLSEHWLWPYELHMLKEIDEEYEGLGEADSRLTETREGGRYDN